MSGVGREEVSAGLVPFDPSQEQRLTLPKYVSAYPLSRIHSSFLLQATLKE